MIDNPAPEKTALAMLEYLWSPFSGFVRPKTRRIREESNTRTIVRGESCPKIAYMPFIFANWSKNNLVA